MPLTSSVPVTPCLSADAALMSLVCESPPWRPFPWLLQMARGVKGYFKNLPHLGEQRKACAVNCAPQRRSRRSALSRAVWKYFTSSCAFCVTSGILCSRGPRPRWHITALCWVSLRPGAVDVSVHVSTVDQMVTQPRTFPEPLHSGASHWVSPGECFGLSRGAKTSTRWLLWPSVFTVSLNTMSSNKKKKQWHSI